MPKKEKDPNAPVQLFICNNTTKVEHCLTTCKHGLAHERDECSLEEYCDIVEKKVKCRKLFKKELTAHELKMNEENNNIRYRSTF